MTSASTAPVALAQDRPVVFTIDDDGLGLVLQPGTTARRKRAGLRLRLSITRDLVELYGGTLVLPEAPPRGLRVTLRLPLARHGH